MGTLPLEGKTHNSNTITSLVRSCESGTELPYTEVAKDDLMATLEKPKEVVKVVDTTTIMGGALAGKKDTTYELSRSTGVEWTPRRAKTKLGTFISPLVHKKILDTIVIDYRVLERETLTTSSLGNFPGAVASTESPTCFVSEKTT